MPYPWALHCLPLVVSFRVDIDQCKISVKLSAYLKFTPRLLILETTQTSCRSILLPRTSYIASKCLFYTISREPSVIIFMNMNELLAHSCVFMLYTFKHLYLHILEQHLSG